MKLTEKLLYAFFPARCTVCDKVLLPGETICEECRGLIIHYPAKKAYCEICGMVHENCPCGKRLLYSHSTVPFFYENDVKSSLHRLKFRGRLDLIKPFAEYVTQALVERDILKDTDVITFIPMRKSSKLSRGYNQAELLADEIGKRTGIPVKQLLCKMTATPKQHSLGYMRRKGNVLGVFEPVSERLTDIDGKRILLIDDIITTGSTLNEAAKTLLIFGAETVNTAAVAQGRKRKTAQKNT